MEEQEYVERAKARIVALLDEHLAMVSFELEARISEAAFDDDGSNINPHHITNALRELVDEGLVVRHTDTTRGGGDVTTIQPADQRKRGSYIEKAAARKRLLYRRYLSWAHSSARYPSGRVGPAGEEAVRIALRDSGALQPAVPNFEAVGGILGVTLPGAIDSAGYLTQLVNGIPVATFTVLVEVKNIRSWIYPGGRGGELYQLLGKATFLQRAQPDQRIIPVFICRKAHDTTFWMARQMGFMVIDMGAQFVGAIDQEQIDTVRRELYFLDLYRGFGPSLRVRERFRDTLPNHCERIAERWRTTALHTALGDRLLALKNTASRDRSHHMEWLRAEAKQAGLRGGW